MSKHDIRFLFGPFLCLVIFLLYGCDPCENLARKMCECEGNPAMGNTIAVNQCKKRIEAAKSQKGFFLVKDKLTNERCAKALETCTCENRDHDPTGICAITIVPNEKE